MVNVSRNIISSANGVVARKEAPRLMTRVAPASVENPDKQDHMHRFVTNQGQHHQLKIVAIAGDPEDEALVSVVLSYPEYYSGVFQFKDWAHVTPYTSAARLLDKRIRQGYAKGISRDMESIMVRCALCDRLFPNTEHGRREMMEHQIYDHENDVNNYFQPQTVAGTNAMGFGDAEATEEDLNPTVADPVGVGEMAFGEEFSLTSERVPEEVLASMESEDAGTANTERVPDRRQNKR